MNTGLMVNERGEACLVHDDPWPSEPSWAEFDTGSRRMVVVTEDGTNHDIGFEVDTQLADYLINGNSLLVVRMEGEKPVEGYDIKLIVHKY